MIPLIIVSKWWGSLALVDSESKSPQSFLCAMHRSRDIHRFWSQSIPSVRADKWAERAWCRGGGSALISCERRTREKNGKGLFCSEHRNKSTPKIWTRIFWKKLCIIPNQIVQFRGCSTEHSRQLYNFKVRKLCIPNSE